MCRVMKVALGARDVPSGQGFGQMSTALEAAQMLPMCMADKKMNGPAPTPAMVGLPSQGHGRKKVSGTQGAIGRAPGSKSPNCPEQKELQEREDARAQEQREFLEQLRVAVAQREAKNQQGLASFGKLSMGQEGLAESHREIKGQ